MLEIKNKRQRWQYILTDVLLSSAGIVCLMNGVIATLKGDIVKSPIF
jgi:hypothetical protein